MSQARGKHSIALYSGGYADPTDLKVEDINILDIQHALANYCRYGGHCRDFYSVAEHSVLVADWLRHNGASAQVELVGLLHDATEAYMPDISRPLKHWKGCEDLCELEEEIFDAIVQKFKLKHRMTNDQWWDAWTQVKEADNQILCLEVIQLWNLHPGAWGLSLPFGTGALRVNCLPPRDAKLLFETRFHELQMLIKEAV